MTIRDAAPDDLDAIVAVYNAAIPGEATADTEPVMPESRRRWLVDRSFERRPVWVCEAAGTVAAWLAFEDFYGRPAYDAAAEIAVYVAPERRGRGIGGALLRRAVERAHELEVSTMLGFVFAHNTASVSLFRRRGFEQWGRLPRVARMPDGERDLLILGRRVEPGGSPGSRRGKRSLTLA